MSDLPPNPTANGGMDWMALAESRSLFHFHRHFPAFTPIYVFSFFSSRILTNMPGAAFRRRSAKTLTQATTQKEEESTDGGVSEKICPRFEQRGSCSYNNCGDVHSYDAHNDYKVEQQRLKGERQKENSRKKLQAKYDAEKAAIAASSAHAASQSQAVGQPVAAKGANGLQGAKNGAGSRSGKWNYLFLQRLMLSMHSSGRSSRPCSSRKTASSSIVICDSRR